MQCDKYTTALDGKKYKYISERLVVFGILIFVKTHRSTPAVPIPFHLRIQLPKAKKPTISSLLSRKMVRMFVGIHFSVYLMRSGFLLVWFFLGLVYELDGLRNGPVIVGMLFYPF